MKRTLLLLAALGLPSAGLHAADPAPTHALTLDPAGKPTADLNLSSSHVTGTLDAARLPAGVGGAFLPGVTRPTGTDASALDHVDVGGIAPGDVRQVVFTTGLAGFEGGTDPATGAPLAYAAATYRLVGGDPASLPPAPDTIPTPTAGEVWRLVTAVLSNGDVCGPNGNVQSRASKLDQGYQGGSIDTSNGGGSINTSANGGSIHTNGGGGIDTTLGGNILTGGTVDTTAGGPITTGYGGIDMTQGGFVATGGNIDTTQGGSITTGYGGYLSTADGQNGSGGFLDLSNAGGPLITSNNGGYVVTSDGGGNIRTNGHGSPEGVLPAPVGSLYTDQDGTAGHVLYVKEPGSDDSHGWAAK